MKQSQAFATLRAAVVEELNHDINITLLPSFNAEVAQIRDVWEKERPESEALADKRKRASMADLVIRRDAFIASLNADMKTKLEKRVSEYGGTITEVTIPDPKDTSRTKSVLEAKFGDGSKARFPKSLWINFKAFDRVWLQE